MKEANNAKKQNCDNHYYLLCAQTPQFNSLNSASSIHNNDYCHLSAIYFPLLHSRQKLLHLGVFILLAICAIVASLSSCPILFLFLQGQEETYFLEKYLSNRLTRHNIVTSTLARSTD